MPRFDVAQHRTMSDRSMFRIAHCLIVLSIVTLYRLYLSNAAVSSWFVGNPGARTRRRSDTGSGLLQRLRKKTRHQSEKIGGSVATFLENIVGGRNPLEFQMGATVFSQGERANSMYFIDRARSRSLWRRFAARTRC